MTVTKVYGPKQGKYEIIIPAAGMGRRMKSYGPKPLVVIKDNITIIKNQLEIFKKLFDSYKIILVCGFEADRLMNYTPQNIIKIENQNYETNNVIRSIGMGLRACQGNKIIVVYGDLVFNKMALNASFDQSSLIIDSSNTMGAEEVGCTINENSEIEHTCFDLPNKWGQILYATGRELELLRKISWNKDNGNMFGFEAINQIINSGGKFKAVSPKNAKITDIDTSKDIEKARLIL